MNIYGKGTIQKHAEVLLILQERFKAQSHLVQEIFSLHVSPLHSDFYQAMLYDDDIYDKLSPSCNDCCIVIKLLVVNMKDVEPHYIRKGIKFFLLSLIASLLFL